MVPDNQKDKGKIPTAGGLVARRLVTDPSESTPTKCGKNVGEARVLSGAASLRRDDVRLFCRSSLVQEVVPLRSDAKNNTALQYGVGVVRRAGRYRGLHPLPHVTTGSYTVSTK